MRRNTGTAVASALSSAVLTPVFLLSLESGTVPLIFLAAIGFFSCGYAASNAVWPSFYAEMFSTKVRFSGLAIGTQLGFLMAGFAPAQVRPAVVTPFACQTPHDTASPPSIRRA